ncbi:flap endonuclease 1 [Rozella allomycis CSF55]|uniref:Flap endonuclease 1 n=1 Tax=Rozella allomycis (strain CSF55) TaxID=988480 RepID=A0A4P9YMC4_ROZAC|nr:flap endonuclease 1 [Rozella allomycis CSF55]
MGIHQLSKVIADHAPDAIKEFSIQQYFGRKVAIDASMSIYQFLIAIRNEGSALMNSDGEETSHIVGLFTRTIRMVEHGIKPVYVFDGKPPTMKSGELAKRLEKRKEAEQAAEKAQEDGDMETVDKFTKRTVKVTKQHNDDCKKLLSLMGIPYIEAPCEAEAQCAALCKAGKVYSAGSEDMDTLTFGSPILSRHLTFSEARKMPISEINLEKVLEGLEMTMDQFIDLCILLGCDYCDSIKGIGPHRAVNLMKTHGSLEKILESLDKKKYEIPEDWPFEQARELFKAPEVLPDVSNVVLKWVAPNEEELIEFLVKKKGFSEDRVKNGVKKLLKAKEAKVQNRLDSYFKKAPVAANSTPKRKADEGKKKTTKKKK